MRINIRQNLEELSHFLAEKFILLAKESIAAKDAFHVAFSGGKTPRYFYQLLADPIYSQQIPWGKIHLYLTDERFVPHSHSDSNFGMIKKLLLDFVPLPFQQIHPIQTEKFSPKDSALEYEKELMLHLSKDSHLKPQMDFILLGLGTDGHIASLFPNTEILKIEDKFAAAVFVEKLESWRISLTFSLINNAKHIALLVAGEEKAKVICQIVDENSVPIIPVQMLNLTGKIELFLDILAAKNISEDPKKIHQSCTIQN